MSIVAKPLNFVISCELMRTILESLSSIAIAAHFYFDSRVGLSARVMDPHERFLGEFVLHRMCFELDENADVDTPLDIPLYFESLVEFITCLPKGFAVKLWPELRCLQGIQLDDCQATNKFTYSNQEDVVYLPNYVAKLFPPVNLETYPYSVVLSKAEFSHQIELALVESEHVFIGICNRFLIFYIEGDGRQQTVIPTACRLHAEHPLLHHGFNDNNTVDIAASNPYERVSKLVQLKGIEDGCLIQQHSLRYLSFVCKARHVCDSVILGMSPQHGMVISFPIRDYGLSKLNKKNVLQEQSYFRYRLLPDVNSKASLLMPFESTIKCLRSKVALDKIIDERKRSNLLQSTNI